MKTVIQKAQIDLPVKPEPYRPFSELTKGPIIVSKDGQQLICVTPKQNETMKLNEEAITLWMKSVMTHINIIHQRVEENNKQPKKADKQ